jgi:Periplasmic copper-binding protein (NosD)
MRTAGFRAVLAAVAVTASLAVPGAVSAARAASGAAVPDLFVANVPGACSDSGSGTEQVPFCTIGAAVAAAVPGQTALVLAGTYPSVTITQSGAPGEPITVQADTVPGAPPVLVSPPSSKSVVIAGPAITVSGAHDIVINGLETGVTMQSPAIDVESSSDITIDSAATGTEKGAPAIQVSGTSSSVTVSRAALEATDAPAVEVGPGTSGVTVTASTITESDGGAPAVQVTGSTGAVLTGNTVAADCGTGIMLSGGSAGAVLENNIVETAPSATAPAACTSGSPVGIDVSADSASHSASDYNLIDPASGGPLYDWAGTDYTSLADFTAATGLGAHDIAADPDLAAASNPNFSWFTLGSASPAINSADASAPGELPTDQLGDPRAQDPAVADTGTGPGYFDRGAVELEGPVTFPQMLLGPDPASTLGVTAVAPVDESWATNVAAGTEDFTFFVPRKVSFTPDIQFPVLTAPPSITHTFTAPGLVGASVQRSFNGMVPSIDSDGEEVDVGFGYTPVTPTRILDTRHGVGVAAEPVPAGATLTLPFTGIGQVPASQIGAVNLNVTVTQPARAGFLTVFSDAAGSATGTSNLNFAAGQTVANLVTVQPGSTGIEFHNGSSGTVQVIADAEGYYGSTGGSFTPAEDPFRVLNTLSGTGAPKAAVGTGKTLTVNLSGDVPPGATAVVLNVTVTQPKAAGFLTAFGGGQARPAASDINFSKGQTVANAVIVPLVNGRVSFFNGSGGTIQLLADLSGYFSSFINVDYVPDGPVRIANTSNGFGVQEGAVPPGGTLTVTPNTSQGFVMVLNVTVTQPTAGGFLTVYPSGEPRPGTSSLNFAAGQTVAVQVTVGEDHVITGGGLVKIFNGSGGTVQIVVDQQGEYDLEIPGSLTN